MVINTTTIVCGGGSIESDPKPEPDAEATSSSSFPLFSACGLEGPDDFLRPFPLYTGSQALHVPKYQRPDIHVVVIVNVINVNVIGRRMLWVFIMDGRDSIQRDGNYYFPKSFALRAYDYFDF